jgi:hypothetical protein
MKNKLIQIHDLIFPCRPNTGNSDEALQIMLKHVKNINPYFEIETAMNEGKTVEFRLNNGSSWSKVLDSLSYDHPPECYRIQPNPKVGEYYQRKGYNDCYILTYDNKLVNIVTGNIWNEPEEGEIFLKPLDAFGGRLHAFTKVNVKINVQ